MAGSIQDLGNGKYKLTVSSGFNPDGTRNRSCKTIIAKGKTPEAKEKYINSQLTLFANSIEKGEHQKPVKLSFEGLFEKWINSHQGEDVLAAKTEERYIQMFDPRINGYFNKFHIEKITALNIDDFFQELRNMPRLDGKPGKLSELTIRHHYRLLSAMFNYAYKKQIIKVNPMDFTEKIHVEDKEPVCYDEIQANHLLDLLESVDMKFKVIVNLAIASGCRIGELGGLTWDCIDFQNNTINIKQVAQYISKLDKGKILQKYPNTPLDLLERNIIIKQPKTKKSKRDIPIHPDVMELVSDYQHEQKVRKVELANKWKKDSNWVFTEELGDLMHPHTGSKWFHKFLVDYNAGIMQDEKIPEGEKKKYLLDEINFHALRHTNASLLIAKGNDIAVVSKRLGHSNVGTTTRIYIHSSDTMSRKAADSMDMFLRGKAKDDKAN